MEVTRTKAATSTEAQDFIVPEGSTLPRFNPSGSDVVAGIKERTDELLQFIGQNVPANRERAIAITNYEQAAMWAVKANFT